MTKAQQPVYQFRLRNGLNCHFKQAKDWQIELFSELPVIQGEKGRFQAAANHLIEHAIMIPEDGLFEKGCTRLNVVKFTLTPPTTESEARSHLDRLGQVIMNPEFKHLKSERERIFEEWAGARDRVKHDLSNWGSFTQPATPDDMDPQDPSLTWDKALQMLNRQADWTKAFTEEELMKQAHFLLEAPKLTLKVSGPMKPPAFFRILKQSKMAHIPENHPEASQISYRDVPAQTNYANISIGTTKLCLSIPKGEEARYQKIMHSAINTLRQDEEIGLYWVKRDQTKETTDWALTITKPKENLMKASLWGYLLMQTVSRHKEIELKQAFENIMLQSKDALRRDEKPMYLQGIKRNGGR